jgi:hypothetical protein
LSFLSLSIFILLFRTYNLISPNQNILFTYYNRSTPNSTQPNPTNQPTQTPPNNPKKRPPKMSTKHFLPTSPTDLVTASLHSLTLTNPGLALDRPNKILYRRPGYGPPPPQQRVHVISGGGSGHEPSFAGMVGPGLLSAAVAGTVFASPGAEQVRVAITGRVGGCDAGDDDGEGEGGGVLVTVMNYTGDLLNFGGGV